MTGALGLRQAELPGSPLQQGGHRSGCQEGDRAGSSAELAWRLEANGPLTAAGDAIALNLIHEGGNLTGHIIVGLVCFFNLGLW